MSREYSRRHTKHFVLLDTRTSYSWWVLRSREVPPAGKVRCLSQSRTIPSRRSLGKLGSGRTASGETGSRQLPTEARRRSLQRTHIRQKLAIRFRLAQLVDQQLHRFHRRERVQHLAQDPDPRQIFPRNQQLFLTRPGALNVDGREHALIHQLALQNNF